jgi:chromosome segregation ATPase
MADDKVKDNSADLAKQLEKKQAELDKALANLEKLQGKHDDLKNAQTSTAKQLEEVKLDLDTATQMNSELQGRLENASISIEQSAKVITLKGKTYKIVGKKIRLPHPDGTISLTADELAESPDHLAALLKMKSGFLVEIKK